ncbi:MAG TPA: SCO family protein [Ginsengibacter sp.]|nr:SCO family protein [Chitinophagaceae bacterium]HRN72619.1 SCO family protein [Ginsengibacter sp.]
MKKKIILYSLFIVVLVGVYLLALTDIKGYFKVELPRLGYVQPFSFIDQDGDSVTSKDVNHKVYVAEYFFTTCTGICPKMNANMALVYNKFKDSADFAIISHTSMPETDSIPLLKAYEEKMIGNNTNNPARWYFVTGDKANLYKMARESYLVDDPNNNSENIDDSFIHTQFFSLVDQQGRVRGIYDGLKKDEIQLLEKDIAKLLKKE